MTCPCCGGIGKHIRHSSGHPLEDCFPCNGTGEIARHGIIEVGIDLEVEWSGDMPSQPLTERFYKLERALRS